MAPFYNINEFKTSLGALLPALFWQNLRLICISLRFEPKRLFAGETVREIERDQHRNSVPYVYAIFRYRKAKHNKKFAKILLGQFFGCGAPTEPVSTGAVTPIAPKKSAPSAIHASKNMFPVL